MKTIVIGDIHGCYNELKNLIYKLEESGEYNKDEDKLIFLGDYLDRGMNSRLVVQFIRDLQKDNDNVIALMGNHEDMALNCINHGDICWAYNGGDKTMDSYEGFETQFFDDLKWIEALPLYHEDEHFIYVHAGVDLDKSLKEQSRDDLLWVRDDFTYSEKEYHKRVVFGHTPTMFFGKGYKPVYTLGNNIGIDTGCVFGGALTALIIEDDEIKSFYQVDKNEEMYV